MRLRLSRYKNTDDKKEDSRMMYKFQGYAPTTTEQPWTGWIAENATVIGHVELFHMD